MAYPPRTVVFSCAGAPFSAEVLRAVHELDPECLEGIGAVVLSRPPVRSRRKPASGERENRKGFLADTRLALAYRARHLVRWSGRRARRAFRGLGLIPPGRWRYIEDFCEERGLPVHHTRRPASRETLDFLAAHGPDLVLMMTFHHILREQTLAVPKNGVFNVHCSLLPDFRGPDPIGDALREGVNRTGVTLFRADTGVDTGEVIAQRTLDIEPDKRSPARLRRGLARRAAAPVAWLLRHGEPSCPLPPQEPSSPSDDGARTREAQERTAGRTDHRMAATPPRSPGR